MKGAFPLLDGPLLWRDPKRVTQMADELIRLEATSSRAVATEALALRSTFSPFQIAMTVDDALYEAQQMLAGHEMAAEA